MNGGQVVDVYGEGHGFPAGASPRWKNFQEPSTEYGRGCASFPPRLAKASVWMHVGSSPLLLLANAGVEPLFRPRAGLAFILPWMGTTPYQLDSLCTFWDEHDPRQNRNKIKILLVS